MGVVERGLSSGDLILGNWVSAKDAVRILWVELFRGNCNNGKGNPKPKRGCGGGGSGGCSLVWTIE